jgi:small-conductance mechanosensitive channel
MAIPWLLALKVIPWGDVIEHAPKVLNAARKLMDRQRTEPAPAVTTSATTDLVSDAQPSLGELKNRLIAAQVQLDRHAQTQAQLTQTLAELAEQNARLVSAVEVLRLRTRLLLWGTAALVLAVAWLAWR